MRLLVACPAGRGQCVNSDCRKLLGRVLGKRCHEERECEARLREKARAQKLEAEKNLLEFVNEPEAEQYRMSVQMRESPK